jgi:hypothetical protein
MSDQSTSEFKALTSRILANCDTSAEKISWTKKAIMSLTSEIVGVKDKDSFNELLSKKSNKRTINSLNKTIKKCDKEVAFASSQIELQLKTIELAKQKKYTCISARKHHVEKFNDGIMSKCIILDTKKTHQPFESQVQEEARSSNVKRQAI